MGVVEDFWTQTGAGIGDGDASGYRQVTTMTHLLCRIEFNLDGLTELNFDMWGSLDGVSDDFPIYRTTEQGINNLVSMGPFISNLFSPGAFCPGMGAGPVVGADPGSGQVPFGIDIAAWPIPAPIAPFPYYFFKIRTSGTANANDSYSLTLLEFDANA